MRIRRPQPKLGLSIGSLFAGIGGLELGLEWAGLGRTVWQVERDRFCRAVLAKHWPSADRSVTDVREATGLQWVDVICGGFPCQDVSSAGKRKGLTGEKSGLWFVFRDVVGVMRPRVAVVENVASGKGKWLCRVRTDLHALGYRTRALQVSASDVGAPHQRRRVFVVAYANGGNLRQQPGRGCRESRPGEAVARQPREGVGQANSHCAGREQQRGSGLLDDWAPCGDDPDGRDRERGVALGYEREFVEAQPRLGRVSDGIPRGVDRWPAGREEKQQMWEPPRVIDHRPDDRRNRLRALGNAVVPQCAVVVGRVVVSDILEGRA